MYSAVIFDMDGVLVDSEIKWKDAEMKYFQNNIPNWNRSKLDSLSGLCLPEVHKQLQHKYDFKISLNEFLKFYDSLAIPLYHNKVEMLPGSMEYIKQLASQGLTLAIASSSKKLWIDTVAKRFGLNKYMSKLISADDVNHHSKPAPDIYLYAAAQINKKPDECVAIEDAKHGVTAAQAAGMKCIGLSSACNQNQDISRADYIANGFSALLNTDINNLFTD